MNMKTFRPRAFAFLMTFLLAFSQFASANPVKNPFLAFQDDAKKLPPVNWIRSRTIDVKHVAIDLRFDWEKESAMGVTTITVAPFTRHRQILSGRGGDDHKFGQTAERHGFEI